MESQNIKVLVRIRPLSQKEIQAGAQSCLITNQQQPDMLILDTKPDQKQFHYDYVSDSTMNQEDIFNIVGKPLSKVFLEGLNCCIFAYGQTGAGKTYTMMGDISSTNTGLQPRVFEHIYDLINFGSSQTQPNQLVEWTIKCSYLEIYNEQILDLLNPQKNTNLNIREDVKKGVYVENLIEEQTTNYEQILALLQNGASNRHIGSTQMNEESSRSHSIFILSVESKTTRQGIIQTKRSKLNFVDLAGSERQKQTAAQGERLKEAGIINRSLTVLGLVINSLVENSSSVNKRHIPYRDSKLTFILRESLGGNSKTFMIANVSAATTQFQETLSTLKFAQRAKLIKNQATINEEMGGSVEMLKAEIVRLKNQLQTVDQIPKVIPNANLANQEQINQLIDQVIKKVHSLKVCEIELEGDVIVDQIEQCKLKLIQNVSELKFNQNLDVQKVMDENMMRKKQISLLNQDILKSSLKNSKEELTTAMQKSEKSMRHLRKENKKLSDQMKSKGPSEIKIEGSEILQENQIQGDVSLWINQAEEISIQKDILKEEIDQKNSEIKNLEIKFNLKTEEVNRQEEELKDQITFFADKVAQQQEEMDTMILSLEFQASEMIKKQSLIDQQQSQIPSLINQVQELEQQIQDINFKSSIIQSNINEQLDGNKHIQSQQEKLIKSLQLQLQESRDQCNPLQQNILELFQELDVANVQKQDLQKQEKSFKDELAFKDLEIISIQIECQQLIKKSNFNEEQLRNQITKCQKQFETCQEKMRVEAESYLKQLEEKSTQVQQSEAKITQLNLVNTTLNDECLSLNQILQGQAESYLEQLEEKQTQVQQSEVQIAQLTLVNTTLNDEYLSLNQILEGQTKINDELKISNHESFDKLQTKENMLKKQIRTTLKLFKKVSSLRHNKRTLAMQIEAKTKLILDIDQELKQLQIDTQHQNQTISSSQIIIEQLEEQNCNFKSNMNNLNQQYELTKSRLVQKELECTQKAMENKLTKQNETLLKDKLKIVLEQSESLKVHCDKVKQDYLNAEEYQEAMRKYSSLQEEFNLNKSSMKKFLETYDQVSNRLTLKEKDCQKLKEELRLEQAYKNKFIKENEEQKQQIIQQRKSMIESEGNLQHFLLEQRIYIEGEDQNLQNDAKYKQLCDNIRTQRKQIVQLNNEINALERNNKKVIDEKELMQRKIEDRLQLPSEINKFKRDINHMLSMKEQLEIYGQDNISLKQQLDFIHKEFIKFDQEKLIKLNNIDDQENNNLEFTVKGYLENLKIQFRALEQKKLDIQCQTQQIQFERSELILLKEENKLLKGQLNRTDQSSGRMFRLRPEGKFLDQVGDSIQKKIKF